MSGMASAVEVLGLRACLAESIMDYGEGLPASWAARTTDECIKSQKDLFMKHHNTADGRIKVWLGIRQIMNSTDRLLTETRDTAKELETGIHMHIAEIPYENQLIIETRGVDNGTVTHLEKIKFLQNHLLAAHTVWVNDKEVDCLAKAGVKVSHCPAAAMRMLGFAPIKEMLRAGVCVSLGTDGAPSNNRMSIVDEMYLASLINKGREVFSTGTTDPTALPAETILRMATINGAKSILWDKEIGSLEVGKKADIVVINPSSWSMMPIHDWYAIILTDNNKHTVERHYYPVIHLLVFMYYSAICIWCLAFSKSCTNIRLSFTYRDVWASFRALQLISQDTCHLSPATISTM
ncbi:uncharacterized protein LOC107013566 isoform X4 [Solanum pennellii]|nr:uncharacterized protein LOC107013566 isoform X4 [Solanum pennellii]XP_027773337.1 uncharacterized protein LOC107013566 isoform X4 [Solanum pennellii]